MKFPTIQEVVEREAARALGLDCTLTPALSTFYNYAALLGLKRKRLKGLVKRQGIRATTPNEYLHVDTTFWGLDHDLKAAIVLVSDNFSKAILGWNIALVHLFHLVALRLQGGWQVGQAVGIFE